MHKYGVCISADEAENDFGSPQLFGDGMQIAVLARTSDDFPDHPAGHCQAGGTLLMPDWVDKQIDIMEQPDNIVAHVNHVWANVGPDLTMLYLQYAVALFIILLVPSLNLCGLSNSRMQQRTYRT